MHCGRSQHGQSRPCGASDVISGKNVSPRTVMVQLALFGMPRALPTCAKDSLAVLPKTITCPDCGLVLRVTQSARGSTTLIYDVNDWQRRCWRINLGSPVMCLVQHAPHRPN